MGVFSIIFGGYVRLAPLNPYPVPDQHLVEFCYGVGEGGVGVFSVIFGGYVRLAPLNPYPVPDQQLVLNLNS